MRDSKSTKRALAASVGCVALCSAMLVGTTFAWFTDTATTNVNSIQAGKLDVALQWKNGDNWESTDGMTLAFKKAAGDTVIWEPGCTYELPEIRVVNNGNLALKYRIEITGFDGDKDLNDVLDWTINDEAFDSTDYSLAAGAQSDALTIKAHMQETANNSYQGKTLSGVMISVTATQDTVEYDSYNNTYDARAAYAVPDTATPVSTAADLATAIEKGEDVVLTEEIEMPAALNVTGDVTIYGSGTGKLVSTDNSGNGRVINLNETEDPVTLTLSGVDIVGPTDNSYNRGVTVYGNSDVTIVMDNCTASANHYAFNIADYNENVNVTVRNSTLTGYSAFQSYSQNTTATFENCTLTGFNQFKNTTDNYAAVVLGNDGNDVATNANLTFKNCRIVATELYTPEEKLLRADKDTTGTVTFEGCTFVHNDKELTTQDEIDKYIFIREGSLVNVVFK